MADPTQYLFNHKELVTLLVKHLDIHEGYWSLSVQFGMGVTNVGQNPNGLDLAPAVVAQLNGLGIQKVPEITIPNLTVDAAEVNPI